MAGRDYYSILGVNRGASEKEIKQAYRRLARRYHPDVNPGDKATEARFKEINEAYEVLADKESRQKYDQFGDRWQYADQFAGAGRQGTRFWDFSFQGGDRAFRFEEGDPGSLFNELFGNLGTRTSGRRVRQNLDIDQPVAVTLEEAYHGTSRMLNLETGQPCPTCGGTGEIQNALCSVCRGSGIAAKIRRLEVKIPPGVRDGSRVRVAGGGRRGYQGTKGDLYLVISVKSHRAFQRKGNDLYVEADVPLATAVLGGEVKVPTLKGKVVLKIPPETQNGRTFRLTGQGMPHLGNSSYGSLFARVNVTLPTKITAEEKELFEQLGKLRPSR